MGKLPTMKFLTKSLMYLFVIYITPYFYMDLSGVVPQSSKLISVDVGYMGVTRWQSKAFLHYLFGQFYVEHIL